MIRTLWSAFFITVTLAAWPGAWAAEDDMRESAAIIAERAEMHKLHAAVRSGNQAAVEAALAAGVDIDRTAALELAILADGALGDRKDIIDLLIERGADVNRLGLSGELPLAIAARRERRDLIQHLIDKGADINRRDSRGMSALDHAQRQGKPDTIEFLKRRGARDRTTERQ